MKRFLKDLYNAASAVISKKEPANQELAVHLPLNSSQKSSSVSLAPPPTPPIKYHSMSVIGSTDDYTDDEFYKDLVILEKPYEIPEEYEEV